MTLRDMIKELEAIYCSTVGAEFMHIQNPKIRTWVLHKLENRDHSLRTNKEVHRDILRKLYEAETFENFLHTKYGGKRFSLEGGEALILALETIVQNSEKRGVKELVMGMAHRGRLNVLANVLNKPLDVIFNEFQGSFAPDSVGGNGDVKYHLGYRNTRTTSTGYEVEVHLAANPSHLEAVDPVVQGKARARQRVLDDTAYRKKVVPILMHGDAAFIGQGIVAEVFNMSQLPGYCTGGTIHIVVNNQIGFTTLPADSRSTDYCTDIAKMIEAPIFHVNGEDPIAVIEMAQHRAGVPPGIRPRRRDRHLLLPPPRPQRRRRADVHAARPLQPDQEPPAPERGLPQPDRIRSARSAMKTRPASRPSPQGTRRGAREGQGHRPTGQEVRVRRDPPPSSSRRIPTSSGRHGHQPETLEHIVKALTTVPEDFRVLPKIKRILLERRLQVWKAGGRTTGPSPRLSPSVRSSSRARPSAFPARTAAAAHSASVTAFFMMSRTASATSR